MSKSRRKALGEDPLSKRGKSKTRHMVSKGRGAKGGDYAWIEGVVEKKGSKRKGKRRRQRVVKTVKKRKYPKLKVKKVKEMAGKPPKRIWKKLKKIERGAILLPKEMMAAAKATGKFTGKITSDVSKMIATGVVTGQKGASKIIRGVQLKFKAAPLKNRLRTLFSRLGKECYKLIGKKKDILKGARVKNLITQIKLSQNQLKKIEEGISS